ncbi:MAG: 50S ribosomal protein L21 [Candidatus Taylorbacteria bacterium RIFCSPLOWO2_12_FULL_43_20]|uniref:Large ribosomal subunit protein bL21 n=1 Tax=Candidatus Taylorbacteria bacterium RIFCSPLOWO2_12_FULL_43_20 TaxID=1802332 RepID=A0A1G2P3Z1_9BACT|nr:MAG: 50S ribosomal protein L21 [Candidatus Taylorbacteria bacterium RIFCSPHIGHO2_01_FULL_43_120]OHA23908.1 MAG: 50S ribosomal protein L21 [Candidatus Taylorbacteria bacterium RIFCSPHIGHO2_02_FULL_43_55]OHA27804.1 MAG: 50S ribosomal protein L21 [Candidatus Taylorbacteria bacterium RIFCSPHIGHO2_12_FULL_42_34]OHA32089.1 MAG: 50S ribosomal protein L21 [Candidatus Taylorbacteria bacterium RIFCSPLOWO2_01_FULL_43_83]OHA39869.1 MAG: 50S ribosomal protein L21 [Candidatus Taylorbacteria bacterium RIFC
MASKKEKNNGGELAVILTGGKQYVVSPGDIINIEKIPGEFKKGDLIVFDKVLLVDDGQDATIGTPYISGAKVNGIFEEAYRDKTVDVIKYKQKSRYYKKYGHRQPHFKVRIESLK